MISNIFTEITKESAIEQFEKLTKDYRDIIAKCSELNKKLDSISDAFSYSKKEREHINGLARDLFNTSTSNFERLKEYLISLSILNFRSKNQIQDIYIEILNIRKIAIASQQGYIDFDIAANADNGTRNLSFELLQSQINTSTSKLLSKKQAEGKTKKRKRKKEPKKKKLETKKKIDFKKLRKHITQRLKPRSKFRRSKTRSKARNKK
tara:strand:+ start:1197 stop:1820 length:624 start_codon:yes stop_codon:yes gene_type:complete